jgi:hypothetical protein
MNEASVVDLTLARLVHLEERIGGAESEGLRARWEFGRELLAARDGKGRLPNGYLKAVCAETKSSRSELVYRMQFAERFPTEDELSNALDSYRSWFSVVSEALAKPKPPAVEATVHAPAGTFATIVADPPWQYDNISTRGAAEDHYPTMSLDELAAIPVYDWSAEQAQQVASECQASIDSSRRRVA